MTTVRSLDQSSFVFSSNSKWPNYQIPNLCPIVLDMGLYHLLSLSPQNQLYFLLHQYLLLYSPIFQLDKFYTDFPISSIWETEPTLVYPPSPMSSY